jgi:hypothetical protein
VALVRCLFLCLIAKTSDLFLKEQINIKFSVELGKNATDTCEMLSKAYGGGAIKESQVFLSGINSSKRDHTMKLQMKTMFTTFFHIKGTVHFEIIPLGQPTKLIMCKY